MTANDPDAQMVIRSLRTWTRRYGHENVRRLTSAWSDNQGRMSDIERMMSDTFDMWKYEYDPGIVREFMETWVYYHPNTVGVPRDRQGRGREESTIGRVEVSEALNWLSPPPPLIRVDDDENCGYSDCDVCAEPLFWAHSRSGQVCLNGHFQVPAEAEERIAQFRKPKRERVEAPSPLDIAMFDAEKKRVARNCEALAERLDITELEEIVENTPWYRPSNEWLPEKIYMLRDMCLSLAEQADESASQGSLGEVDAACTEISDSSSLADALMMIRHRSFDIASQLSQQAQGNIHYYSDTSNPVRIIRIERGASPAVQNQAVGTRLALPPGKTNEVVAGVKILRSWEEDEEDYEDEDGYDDDTDRYEDDVDDEPLRRPGTYSSGQSLSVGPGTIRGGMVRKNPRRTDSLLVDMLSSIIRLAQREQSLSGRPGTN